MNNILGGYLMPHAPILIKEIGQGEEKKCPDTLDSMKRIGKEIKNKEPETIIIITPHGNLLSDAITINGNQILEGDFKNFGNYNLNFNFKNDIELVDLIWEISEKKGIRTYKFSKESKDYYNLSQDLDHGALVPLYFIEKEYKDFELVHINYSLFPGEKLYEFGKILKTALVKLDRKAVIIASGDLSHKLSRHSPNGYSPKGKIFDEKILELLDNKNFDEIKTFDKKLSQDAGECGLRSLQILIGAFDGEDIATEVLSYEGPFGVGYGSGKIEILKEENNEYIKLAKEENNRHVKLAKEAIEYYINNNKTMSLPKDIENDDFYNTKSGTFVTLKKDGQLRGCIGTIYPNKDSLGEEIIENAISAAFRDPRFYPVKKEELGEIEYSVDVMGKPEKISSIKELDPSKYGVIVTKGSRKGLLLPNLEGINTVEEQIGIALRKAGIDENEDYIIEKFKVTRYK